METELESRISKLKTQSNSRLTKKKNWHHNNNVFINAPPKGLEKEYEELFTNDAIEFLVDMIIRFESDIEELYSRRLSRKSELRSSTKIPKFSRTAKSTDDNWKVAPVGERLQNRHLDLGDVSPSDFSHFTAALRSPVQGIQVDFDDGHCPTWRNQILGMHNIKLAISGLIPGIPKISEAPVLMLRPRAWNMIEKNLSINGRRIPGPVFDFGLLMFHHGRSILEETRSGPSFYLSKLEGAAEAKLWNDIFIWSEIRLGFPRGTVKACVLIENILSAFEMNDILWELREHSLGLNCGIWDYAASIIAKFGTNDPNFLLPDRQKYVNVNKKFLRSYMQLVVRVCHKRGAHATGGMAANLLPVKKEACDENSRKILTTVYNAKLEEIKIGLDGFMVYDLGLVGMINELWWVHVGDLRNQINLLPANSMEDIKEEDLLSLPKGGVTLAGLEHNIRVGLLFIYNWLNGIGNFAHNGFIEDSATAEISRSQVWQWIRYQAKLEDHDGRVTSALVKKKMSRILFETQKDYGMSVDSNHKLLVAKDLFLELVNKREFPEFITTYLNDEQIFRKIHSNL